MIQIATASHLSNKFFCDYDNGNDAKSRMAKYRTQMMATLTMTTTTLKRIAYEMFQIDKLYRPTNGYRETSSDTQKDRRRQTETETGP